MNDKIRTRNILWSPEQVFSFGSSRLPRSTMLFARCSAKKNPSIFTPSFGRGFPFPFRLLGPEGVVTLGEAKTLSLQRQGTF